MKNKVTESDIKRKVTICLTMTAGYPYMSNNEQQGVCMFDDNKETNHVLDNNNVPAVHIEQSPIDRKESMHTSSHVNYTAQNQSV